MTDTSTTQCLIETSQKEFFEVCYIPNIFKASIRHKFQIEIPDETINYSKLEEIILDNLKKTKPEDCPNITRDQMMLFKETYMIRTNDVFTVKDLKDLKLYLLKNERNPLLIDESIENPNPMFDAFRQLLGANFNITPVANGNTVYFTIPFSEGQNPNDLLSLFQNQLSSALNIPVSTNVVNTVDLSANVRNIDLFNNQSSVQEEAFIRYETQLKELHTLGFIDDVINIEALILNEGNLEASIEFILNSMG